MALVAQSIKAPMECLSENFRKDPQRREFDNSYEFCAFNNGAKYQHPLILKRALFE